MIFAPAGQAKPRPLIAIAALAYSHLNICDFDRMARRTLSKGTKEPVANGILDDNLTNFPPPLTTS